MTELAEENDLDFQQLMGLSPEAMRLVFLVREEAGRERLIAQAIRQIVDKCGKTPSAGQLEIAFTARVGNRECCLFSRSTLKRALRRFRAQRAGEDIGERSGGPGCSSVS